MSHAHVAGAIHADAEAGLRTGSPARATSTPCCRRLWSRDVEKDADGRAAPWPGCGVDEIAAQVGTPVYVVDEADLRPGPETSRPPSPAGTSTTPGSPSSAPRWPAG